jgi:hypothetical protein
VTLKAETNVSISGATQSTVADITSSTVASIKPSSSSGAAIELALVLDDADSAEEVALQSHQTASLFSSTVSPSALTAVSSSSLSSTSDNSAYASSPAAAESVSFSEVASILESKSMSSGNTKQINGVEQIPTSVNEIIKNDANPLRSEGNEHEDGITTPYLFSTTPQNNLSEVNNNKQSSIDIIDIGNTNLVADGEVTNETVSFHSSQEMPLSSISTQALPTTISSSLPFTVPSSFFTNLSSSSPAVPPSSSSSKQTVWFGGEPGEEERGEEEETTNSPKVDGTTATMPTSATSSTRVSKGQDQLAATVTSTERTLANTTSMDSFEDQMQLIHSRSPKKEIAVESSSLASTTSLASQFSYSEVATSVSPKQFLSSASMMEVSSTPVYSMSFVFGGSSSTTTTTPTLSTEIEHTTAVNSTRASSASTFNPTNDSSSQSSTLDAASLPSSTSPNPSTEPSFSSSPITSPPTTTPITADGNAYNVSSSQYAGILSSKQLETADGQQSEFHYLNTSTTTTDSSRDQTLPTALIEATSNASSNIIDSSSATLSQPQPAESSSPSAGSISPAAVSATVEDELTIYDGGSAGPLCAPTRELHSSSAVDVDGCVSL